MGKLHWILECLNRMDPTLCQGLECVREIWNCAGIFMFVHWRIHSADQSRCWLCCVFTDRWTSGIHQIVVTSGTADQWIPCQYYMFERLETPKAQQINGIYLCMHLVVERFETPRLSLWGVGCQRNASFAAQLDMKDANKIRSDGKGLLRTWQHTARCLLGTVPRLHTTCTLVLCHIERFFMYFFASGRMPHSQLYPSRDPNCQAQTKLKFMYSPFPFWSSFSWDHLTTSMQPHVSNNSKQDKRILERIW